MSAAMELIIATVTPGVITVQVLSFAFAAMDKAVMKGLALVCVLGFESQLFFSNIFT